MDCRAGRARDGRNPRYEPPGDLSGRAVGPHRPPALLLRDGEGRKIAGRASAHLLHIQLKPKESPMAQLSGRRVLITGASGLVALPVAVELAKANEVYAVARFSDPEQRRKIEAAGARPIVFDLAQKDLSPLPKTVDVVINYGVLPPTHKDAYEVNAGAVGRLARRYRECEAFVHGSTGSLYAYQGERPLREDDAYGLHSSAENYAA